MNWATWVFSGIGIAVPIALISWFLAGKSSGKSTSIKQRIKSGRQSTNIQIAGDAEIGTIGSREDGTGR